MSLPTPISVSQLLESKYQGKKTSSEALVGFDGFTDDIIAVVDQRCNGSVRYMEKISQFGERILSASGQSCNLELINLDKRLGGNAPLLTNALLRLEQKCTFVGTIGEKERIEPLFSGLAESCQEAFSLGASGHTDALEFVDGKVLLGKTDSMNAVTYDNLIDRVGAQHLDRLLERCPLVASVNWTMCPHMSDLWQGLLENHLPKLSVDRRRWWFVDLADPAKRTDEELAHALTLLQQFAPYYRVVLGLNISEATRVSTLGAGPPGGSGLESLAHAIQIGFEFEQVVVHGKGEKLGAVATPDIVGSISAPLCEHPKISTGAGDNFNAGYCHGLLLGLEPLEALHVAVGTSGFYVRTGQSPIRKELVNFMQEWHHRLSSL